MHSGIAFFVRKATGMFVLPRWWFCCCGQWRTVVRWALFSFPSRGAGSCGLICAGIWVSCKVKAAGTEGLRTCPLRLAVPGRYWLPVRGNRNHVIWCYNVQQNRVNKTLFYLSIHLSVHPLIHTTLGSLTFLNIFWPMNNTQNTSIYNREKNEKTIANVQMCSVAISVQCVLNPNKIKPQE